MTQARQFHFDSALLADGWAGDVVISVNVDGTITNIATGSARGRAEHVSGIAIPGMVNVHSHAFQRAFAGLSEFQTSQHDSFWTWRNLMYDFVERLTPEEIYTTARGLYSELWSFGYTWVGEFHYVHNAPDGKPYDEPSCLADAVIQAAKDVGIGICILPVLYQRGGFQNEELTPAQRRFHLTDDAFLDLVSDLRSRHGDDPQVQVGIAFHSLRAVDMETTRRVANAYQADSPDGVIHIHIAEQTKEIDDCVAAHGRRSVEYLYSEVDVDDHWCLIHATHLTDSEIRSIADSGAIAGLCPTTEANLGDGIFPALDFLNANGRISIGSDSHISVSPRSELRLLEYGQRLTRRARAVLGTEAQSVGNRLYHAAASGGAAAIGVSTGPLQVRNRADIVVLDPDHPAIANTSSDRILDRYVFCDAGSPVLRTICGGR